MRMSEVEIINLYQKRLESTDKRETLSIDWDKYSQNKI